MLSAGLLNCPFAHVQLQLLTAFSEFHLFLLLLVTPSSYINMAVMHILRL